MIALIKPHYLKGKDGQPAYPPMSMLRVHLMQNWFGYTNQVIEETLYETSIMHQFLGD